MKYQILIIEDEPANIHILNESLKEQYQVLFATNGEEGLCLARQELPDLILLDIIMPEMDGFEVCQQLKAGSQTRDIPVIFITALTDTNEEKRGLDAGAIDYIQKPFSPAIVLARVQNHIELKRYRDIAQNKYQAIVDNIDMGIMLLDQDLRILETNRAMQQWFPQLNPTDKITCYELLFGDEQGQPCDNCLINISKNDSKGQRVVKRVMDDKDHYLRLLNTPVMDNNNNVTGYVEIVEDVTERIEAAQALLRLNATLEQKVADRTRALEHTNQELEAFTYSVSHDLRAPLRSIDGFSNILISKFGEKLQPTMQDYLQRIQRASKRMGQIIDDLLALTRISQTEVHATQVDLGAMAHEILDDLQQHEPQRKADFKIADDLMAYCDPKMMRIALENLLGNAWKFTAKKDKTCIEFYKKEREGKPTTFNIRDNGAGFDMQYADNIFEPFQRLHSESDFEGTGIGMATVKKIFCQHNGHVIAQGKPEHGATISFYFAPYTESREEPTKVAPERLYT